MIENIVYKDYREHNPGIISNKVIICGVTCGLCYAIDEV